MSTLSMILAGLAEMLGFRPRRRVVVHRVPPYFLR